MGEQSVVAVNLLGWPREKRPFDLAAEVLRGGMSVAREAGCYLAAATALTTLNRNAVLQ